MRETLATQLAAGYAPGQRFFEETGEPVDAGSDRPWLLDGDGAWLVRSGQVDVFAVRVEGAQAVGSRAHLFRVEAGQPLLALGPTPAGLSHALLAVGTSGTQLLALPQPVLRTVGGRPEDAGELFALVDRWVESLCAGITRDVTPRRCAELESGVEVKLEAPAAVRPRRSVSWVRHVEGHSLLLGREGLKVNGTGYTPISRRAWLQVNGKSRLVLADAEQLLVDPDQLWDGLARLHELVLRYADQMAAAATAASRERMRRKAVSDRAALTEAYGRLAAAMRPDAPPAGRPAAAAPDETSAAPGAAAMDWHAATFEACRLVGSALDVVVKPYPTVEGAPPPRDPVAAIARASRLRARSVALRDGWWRHDNGPLLGAIEDGDGANPGGAPAPKRPAALLPARRGGYVLHDPMRGTVQPVTADVAATLVPFAQTFYRPFPDTPLSIRDVVTFGFRGCGRDLATVVLVGAAGALLGMVPSVATGVLYNTVIPGAQRSQLLQMTMVLLVAAISTAMFNVTRSVAMLRIEGRMGASIQAAVWDRLLSLPMPFFRPYAAGDLAVRAMGIDAIRQVISGTTITAILSGIFSLVNFGLMFHYSAAMAWRATALIAVAMAVTALGSWLQLTHQRGISALEAKTSGLVLQLLSGIAKLRVGGAEARAFAVWARRFSEQRRLQFRARRIGNVVAAFNAAFPVVASGAIFWAALPLIKAGDADTLRTGDFLAFLSAYGACQGALLGTCMALLSTLHAVPLYEQAKPILQARPEVDTAKSDPGTLAGDIEIQHAVFRYQPDGAAVLRDLTLHVKPGEFVAFVGPSGSGKSTILRLLLGFERLESGAIYYDGQELGGLDVQAVRRQIGVVLQTGRLMSGDIYTNIVGSAPLSVDDAWEAARMAGFDADVKAMPMGMHTVISDGGGTLSGGQRQRLLIARAIVHRPRLIFFDEATSALDNRTQAVVSASLEKLQATRIVVAHRLSTIVNADRIVVIEKGRVVQSGTYKELIEREGLFAELAKRQLA